MSDYLIGAELAGSQLKLAVFRKSGHGFNVVSFSKITLGGSIQDNRKKLLDWKKKCLSGEAKASATIAVPESTLYLKKLSLPKIPEKQTDEAVFWEVAGEAPFSKDNIVCEWVGLPNDENKKQEVLAICAKSSTVAKTVSSFEDIGIKVLAVEPASFSFGRIAQADFEQTTLLIIVENEETNLLVLKKGNPLFTTSISTPLRREKSGKRRLSDLVIKDLAQQAQKTINYWEDKSDEKISQVIITGDIAQKYYGLADAVNKLAKIPALMASKKKLKNLNFSDIANAVQLRYLIPIGAFYRLVKSGDTKINLLPPDKKEAVKSYLVRQKLKQTSLFLSVANFTLALIAIITLVALSVWNKSLVKLADQKRTQVKSHQAQAYISKVNETNNLAEIIDTLIDKQKDMGARLDTVSRMTPRTVRLTSIDFGQLESEEWQVEGVGSRVDVLYFYDKLKADAEANTVDMPYSNLSKPDDNEFAIKILW